MFGGNFAPAAWAFCNGMLLPISQYETLFNLIGTTYGGDGQNTFGLPNLQGRLPVHTDAGANFPIAKIAGEETVTLTVNQLPVHNHGFVATTNAGSATNPGGSTLARFAGNSAYFQGPATAALAPMRTGRSRSFSFVGASFSVARYSTPSPKGNRPSTHTVSRSSTLAKQT